MSQSKDPQEPREFWIDLSDEHDGDLPLAFIEHPQQGPLQWQSSLVHVIEYSAYQSLKSKLAEAEAEIVEFVTNDIISLAHVQGNETKIADHLRRYGIKKILENLKSRNKTAVIQDLIALCEKALKSEGK